MFILLTFLSIYLGWGTFLIINDFIDKTCKSPMYIVNLRNKQDRFLCLTIALLKIFLWPLVYIVKYF